MVGSLEVASLSLCFIIYNVENNEFVGLLKGTNGVMFIMC